MKTGGRKQGVAAFRYQARVKTGAPVNGVIEADTRQGALHLLAEQGLFPSSLETLARAETAEKVEAASPAVSAPRHGLSRRVSRKEITAFTREMATLLE